MPDPTTADAPPPRHAPTTDELTPFDLHGPGRCEHPGCWERAEADRG